MTDLKVCWIGGTRYTRPLNATLDAKWKALTALDAELFVIGFASDLRPRRFTRHAHFYLLPQLPLPILRYAEIYLIAPFILLWLVLRHGLKVIIAQSPFEGVSGALVKQIVGLFGRQVAFVVESHGDFEVAVFTQRRVMFAGVYRWLMKRAADYSFRHADALRAVSSSARAQLEDWSPGKPIEQFMTWIDFEAFSSIEREKPLTQSWDLVCAGVLIPRKGQHILIEAFAQIADEFPLASLWLIGKPENLPYTAQLKQQVLQLGLESRVKFVDAVPQAELARYMARARALVLVSSSEGLPRVVVEAMNGGLVPVGSRVSGIPDVIQDRVTGYLVPPEDVGVLVETLREMYRNPTIDAMGERAREFARQFFSRAAYVEGYRRLITTALHRLPTPDSAAPLASDDRKTPVG